MKVSHAIKDTLSAEAALARRLRVTGERHAVEHDLCQLAHTLAGQCDSRVRELAPFAEHYGTRVSAQGRSGPPGVISAGRRKMAEATGRSQATGLLLLRDLRQLYLAAQDAEIAWVILAQAAQAVRDPALLDVSQAAREQAENCGNWVRTRIKESSPQILATG